jgi:hypothetical protein
MNGTPSPDRIVALGGANGNGPAFPYWADWGKVIRAVALSDLPYLHDLSVVLDATYGRGVFWKHWQPANGKLVSNDIDPRRTVDHRWDWFTTPPPTEWRDFFDTVILDPDFKMSGTNQIMLDRYGLDNDDPNLRRMAKLFVGALAAGECVRPGGWLMVKCQPQVAGGRLHHQPRRVANLLEDHGWEQVGEIHRQYRPVPQPAKTRADGEPVLQGHEHRNYSTLVICQRKLPLRSDGR